MSRYASNARTLATARTSIRKEATTEGTPAKGWKESSNSRNDINSRYASNAKTPATARTSNSKDATTLGTPGTKGTLRNIMDAGNSKNASKSTDASNSNDISNSRDSGNNNSISRMLTRAGAPATAGKTSSNRYA